MWCNIDYRVVVFNYVYMIMIVSLCPQNLDTFGIKKALAMCCKIPGHPPTNMQKEVFKKRIKNFCLCNTERNRN